ncbi:unnamed protein product [Rotaria magnacalcarata]|nr:unnamed protein product [Rotaria magnacalcarata]
MRNLAHHYKDFHIEASWTFSASGHGKGGPHVSFSSPKQFYEWCFEKNDRMVVARPRRMEASTASSTMPEPNRPIEIRWLPADIVNQDAEKNLLPRWNRLSTRDSISGIRDIHQFDADQDGSITCRRTSQSKTSTKHTFKIHVLNL